MITPLSLESPDGAITNYGNDELRAFVRRTSDPDFDLMYATAEEARASAEAFKASVLGADDTVLGERVTITPQPQASVVIMDQSTGYVKAIVGGRGEKEASLYLKPGHLHQTAAGLHLQNHYRLRAGPGCLRENPALHLRQRALQLRGRHPGQQLGSEQLYRPHHHPGGYCPLHQRGSCPLHHGDYSPAGL